MKEEANKSQVNINNKLDSRMGTKTTKRIRLITLTAILATLVTIMTAYVFHIPVPISGGYIHVGDSLIYLAATILPMPYAMLAGAIGGAMADLLTAPMWIIPTFLIKALIVIPFTNKGTKIINMRNVIATILAYVISSIGYYFFSKVIFGSEVAFLVSVMASFAQSFGSAMIFILMGMALDKKNIKKRIFNM